MLGWLFTLQDNMRPIDCQLHGNVMHEMVSFRSLYPQAMQVLAKLAGTNNLPQPMGTGFGVNGIPSYIPKLYFQI